MNTTSVSKLSYAIKIALASTALGMVAIPAVSVAQESANSDDNIEKIAVTGIRGSQKANINAKRFSNAIVDAITAEDIGKFPDKNVAESLSRVPGITIDRDFGEGQGVTIRGQQPDKNLTLLNGQAVGTAQWFVLDTAGRNFNFEMLASEMVGGLEVYKSAQADIDEGAIGGTVILRTRKPLDLENNTMQGSVEGQYNDIAEETDPSFSGLYSWKNDEETFGILVAASFQERTVRRETNEDFGWFGPSIPRIEPGLEPPNGATQKGATAWGIGSALFQQERERIGYDITAQWAPSDDLDMTLHYLSSTLKADNVNSNLIGIPFRGVFALFSDDFPNGPTNPGTVNSDGVIESLQVFGLENRPGWARHIAYDTIYRDGSEASTEVLDFEGNYNLESGKLHWQIGRTIGEGTNNDFFTEFWVDQTDPRAAFDYFNPGGTNPYIDFVGPSPWLQNPGDEMWLGGIFDQRNVGEDEENYLQLDYTQEVDLGAVTSIKSGLKIRDRSFTQNRFRTSINNLAAIGEGSLGPASQFWSGDMVNVSHENTNALAASYFAPDKQAMFNALYAVPDCVAGDDSGAQCLNRDAFLSEASYSIEEDITALYVMANFEADRLRGNVGVRYVQTDQDSNGFNLVTGDPVTISGEYADWLPSLNVSYDLTDEIILRAAAGKTLARAAPFQLSASFNLTPETSSGNAGNPNLDPERATNFEMGVEWYFDDASIFTVTAFTKDLSGIIVNKVVAREVNGVQINQLNTPINAGTATVEGVEMQIQHAWENGFGGYFNFTYNDVSEVNDGDRLIDLPFNSKESYNAGVYYEDDVFSARLNYNYRSEYFLASTEFGNRYRDDQRQLDAQLSYNLSENITLTLEALNITDEIWENYYERATDGLRVGGTQSANGRRFFAGARFKF